MAEGGAQMHVHRGTWLAIVSAVIVFLLLNVHSWRPGIGGRTDRINDAQPNGSELELSYGWPACYRAELLRSDDPGMGARVLETAPFYLPPYAEGWVSARYIGWQAVALDVAFAVLGLILVAVVFECVQRERWPRRAIIAVVAIVFLLAAGYASSEAVGVHL